MKPLFKLLVSLLIKLGIIALLYAIAMGFTSCSSGYDTPEVLSFSQLNKEDPVSVTESSVEETTPTSSFWQAEESNKESTEVTETTTSIEVAESTYQTRDTVRSSEPANTVRVNNNQDRAHTQATATPTPKPTKAPTSAPTATPKPTSTPKPTATPKPTTAPTATPKPTATPTPEPTEAPEPTKAPTSTPKPTPTPKPVNDPKYTKCIADVEYWAGQDNCYHGYVYGVPCRRNSAGRWVTTREGEEMVWDAIEAEHPDYGGYSSKIVQGSQRNFS